MASKIQISEEQVDVRMELWYCCIPVYYFSVARPRDRPAGPATVTLPAALLLSLLVAKVRDNDAYQISGIALLEQVPLEAPIDLSNHIPVT